MAGGTHREKRVAYMLEDHTAQGPVTLLVLFRVEGVIRGQVSTGLQGWTR